MRYLSGCTSPSYESDLIAMGVGLLIQPGSYSALRVMPFSCWAADNACYPPDDDPSRKKPWSAATWARMLGGISELDEPTQRRCLFVLVPDWPFSHAKTLERFEKYAGVVRAFGLPLAFAIQDGASVESVPWDEFDVAFLAGTTEWKCGQPAYEMALAARARDKWIHAGRVNSWSRLDWTSMIGCDSADGTFMKHGAPKEMVARMKVWLDQNEPRLTQKMAAS